MPDIIYRPSFFIVCDDVRKEDNGKMMYIGCYEQDIIVSEIPSVLLTRLVLFGNADEPGTVSLDVKGELNSEKSFAGNIKATILKKGLASFLLPPIGIEFKTEGTLTFSVKVGDGDWQNMWTGQVIKAAVAAPP